MSKKLAAGSDALVLDESRRRRRMKRQTDARKLAQMMVGIAGVSTGACPDHR
jgi:thymidine phosphorylase